MKSKIIAAVSVVVVLSSCSVYRSGQTPDEVYYSPGKTQEQAAYVEANGDRDDGRRYNQQPNYNGYDDYATSDDRWLMMRVRNRNRWSYFDDYNSYNPYSNFGYNGFGGYGSYGFGYQPGFSFGLGFGSFYDPWGSSFNRFNDYYNWNSYYNPYYPNVIVVNPKTNPGAYNSIRNFNLNTYNNRSYNNSRSTMAPRVNSRNYNNSNSTLGNSFRRIFSNGNNSNARPAPSNENYRPSQSRPSREYAPSNNSSNNSTYTPRNSGTNSGSNSGSSGSSSGSRPNRR